MFGSRNVLLLVVICAAVELLVAQGKTGRPPGQSPRQALLEMITGGDDAFRKHLTLEVQRKLEAMQKNSPPGGAGPAQALQVARAGGDNFETFEAGPVLFSLNNPEEHERWEVRIDGEDLKNDECQMELSLHKFHRGIEEELPMGLRLQLSLKQQQGIWRLNSVTVSARLSAGDPRILDKSWWGGVPTMAASPSTASPGSASSAAAPPGADVQKMPPARSLRLITLAEDLYAQKHPGNGFTCTLSELVEIGRGFEDGEPYRFMAPEFAQGAYNGYRFSLRGCSGKMVKSFQAIAEPQSGQGNAYCTDETKTVRASDDGSGGTCLVSGKIVQR